jgi:hypothetical protein
MYPASSLREIASINARTVFANVVRSLRRSGQVAAARQMLRAARECGTYPVPVRVNAFR